MGKLTLRRKKAKKIKILKFENKRGICFCFCFRGAMTTAQDDKTLKKSNIETRGQIDISY